MDIDHRTHLDLWVEYLEGIKGLLPNTTRLYRRTIEKLLEDEGTLDLTQEDLEAWLLRKGGRAGSYANRLCALRSIYRWEVRTKRRDVDPTVAIESPKQHKGIPKPVKDIEHVLELLDECDRRANEWGAIPRPVGQSRAMAVFLAESGLRIHEAVALKVPVPCPDSLTLIGKGAKEAIVPLTKRAREALDFLGGEWPIGARATQRRFEKAGTHPHAFRHWRATSLVQAGVEIGTVSKIMRHSSPTTTMIYAAYGQQQLRDALESVNSA